MSPVGFFGFPNWRQLAVPLWHKSAYSRFFLCMSVNNI